LEKILTEDPDLIFLDILMRPEGRYGGCSKEVRESPPHDPVIMLTATKTMKTAVEAMKARGAGLYYQTLRRGELKIIADKALESRDLRTENRLSRRRSKNATDSTTSSANPRRCGYFTEPSRQIAERNSTVLIHGESGTGKKTGGPGDSLQQPRKKQTFVAVNCAAIPRP